MDGRLQGLFLFVANQAPLLGNLIAFASARLGQQLRSFRTRA